MIQPTPLASQRLVPYRVNARYGILVWRPVSDVCCTNLGRKCRRGRWLVGGAAASREISRNFRTYVSQLVKLCGIIAQPFVLCMYSTFRISLATEPVRQSLSKSEPSNQCPSPRFLQNVCNLHSVYGCRQGSRIYSFILLHITDYVLKRVDLFTAEQHHALSPLRHPSYVIYTYIQT